MWARGRAKRREQQRLHVELDVQTTAEISESVLIHLQNSSAHWFVGFYGAPSMPTPSLQKKRKLAKCLKLNVITFMYVLSSGILLSAISLLLPMKTFPKQKHVQCLRSAELKSTDVLCIKSAQHNYSRMWRQTEKGTGTGISLGKSMYDEHNHHVLWHINTDIWTKWPARMWITFHLLF